MNLATAIKLYADGSSLVNVNEAEDIRVKDTARRRLVKTSPDVDSEEEDESKQRGNGKKKKDKRSIQKEMGVKAIGIDVLR